MAADRADPAHGRFFTIWSVAMAAAIFLSFPMTYFWPVASGEKHFILLRHLHGLVFFAWTALFALQAVLIRMRRIRLHRELGLLGAALVGAMVPLGLWMAGTAIEERIAKGMALPFEFAIYNLVDITLFAAAMGTAIYQATRNTEAHRRLTFVAMVLLLGPAWSRWLLLMPVPFPWLDMSPNLAADALLLVLAWHDRRVLGRLHPVTQWSILLLIPFHAVEPLIARSLAWNTVAPALFGF